MKIILSASEKIILGSAVSSLLPKDKDTLFHRAVTKAVSFEGCPNGDFVVSIDNSYFIDVVEAVSSRAAVAFGVLMSMRGIFESFDREMFYINARYDMKREN